MSRNQETEEFYVKDLAAPFFPATEQEGPLAPIGMCCTNESGTFQPNPPRPGVTPQQQKERKAALLSELENRLAA